MSVDRTEVEHKIYVPQRSVPKQKLPVLTVAKIQFLSWIEPYFDDTLQILAWRDQKRHNSAKCNIAIAK